jgi:hypothetical protein
MTMLATDAKNREFELTIAIGAPYEHPEGGWACPSSMHGVWGDFAHMRGVDSWQALTLAYGLIAKMLIHFVNEGGRLRWPDTGTPITPEELFPRITARD